METSQIRKRMPVSAMLDPKIVFPAIGSAFAKLDPRTLIKNPVMFVLEIVTALTTIILIRDLFAGSGMKQDLFVCHPQVSGYRISARQRGGLSACNQITKNSWINLRQINV